MSDPSTNPFRARRPWPPDLSTLSPKHQFRLERRYKRRAKLKWARPTFMKVTKAAQILSVTAVAVYGVFFMDWSQGKAGIDEGQVFAPAREWARRTFGEYRLPERGREGVRKEGGD